MYYHLRYTPYELSSENLPDFCDKYQRYIIAHERYKKDGITETIPHFHVWLDSDRNLDSIRTAFKKALGIPTGGQGRNNKYYSLELYRKQEDVTYIIKQKNIIACKGFDKEELLARVPPDSKKEEKNTVREAAPPAASKKKESNFWNQIVERTILWEKINSKKIEELDAVKLITRVYMGKGLPLPHPGDRKRWAKSLLMYSKMNWEYNEQQHESIIEEEAASFISDEMIKISR